ncbi:MAG: hypothetical protein R6V19_03945 [Armatimonadota bacterium]
MMGEAGSEPQDLDAVMSDIDHETQESGPQITFEGTEPGYVYGDQATFVITSSDRPWRINISGTPMQLQGGTTEQQIPMSRIEVRDAKKPTEWAPLSGGPQLENAAGEEEQWMQIEFRILLEAGDVPGYYVNDVFMEWMLQPLPGEEPQTGSIPLELHLNIEANLQVAVEQNVMYFHYGVDQVGTSLENDFNVHMSTNTPIHVGLVGEDDASPTEITRTLSFDLEEVDGPVIPAEWEMRSNNGAGWSSWIDPTEGEMSDGTPALYWLLGGGEPGTYDIQFKCSPETFEEFRKAGHYELPMQLHIVPAL